MQAEYARQYRTLWERHWWWRSREAHVLSWVKSLRKEHSAAWRILDVGCGDGLFFEALEPFGMVEGLEPDASLVTDPRWRERIKVARLSENAGTLPDSTYDLILMLDVLEHIDDDHAALRALHKSLRPGGRLLLTVPALQWLWSGHDVANAHYRRYDRETLRRALEDSGFRVESLRFYFIWTVLPMLARRWLDPAGRRIRADHAISILPPMLNRMLTMASRGEHSLGKYVRWPLGSSLLAVVCKSD